jgi:hypothetical protein
MAYPPPPAPARLRPCETVRQSDLTGYLKAVQAAGYDLPRVIIRPDGTVVIEVTEDASAPENPCDVLLK